MCLAITAFAPNFASAGTTYAAVGENQYGYGDCSTFESHGGTDDVEAFNDRAGFVYVAGQSSSYCNPAGSGGSNGISGFGCEFVAHTCTGAGWNDYNNGPYSGCDMYATSPVGYTDLGSCPAGSPPNPGWGALLP